MPVEIQWPLLPDGPAVPAVAPALPEAPADAINLDFLGFGLLRPFQRDLKNDWANAGGARLVRSAVGQVLATRSSSEFAEGELRWRPEFGSVLNQIRFRNNNEILAEVARVHIVDALKRWEPRVLIKRTEILRTSAGGNTEDTLLMRIIYDLIDQNVPGNRVLLADQEVIVPLAA